MINMVFPVQIGIQDYPQVFAFCYPIQAFPTYS